LFMVQLTYAQTNNPPTVPTYEQTITPPSPNPAALDRYIDCPVSYSTGVPDISIPLYTLKSTKLSVPISLSYHGGGVKVSDRSVTMGLGWSLNAGGSISRTIQDIPDELTGPNFTGYWSMIYPDENRTYSYLKDLCLGNSIYNVYVDSAYKHDGQPDIFYYSFNGQGGKFMFRKGIIPGVPLQGVTIPYSPIKITWNTNGLELTDQQGNLYECGKTATDSYFNGQADASSPNSATTAWHL